TKKKAFEHWVGKSLRRRSQEEKAEKRRFSRQRWVSEWRGGGGGDPPPQQKPLLQAVGRTQGIERQSELQHDGRPLCGTTGGQLQ
ncbi:MAG TPA: hypothetical protein DD662_00750, partial [Planctomycetaceae bacterium]|nr:hypothetical protein [Planctomycetaceae bacterium]